MKLAVWCSLSLSCAAISFAAETIPDFNLPDLSVSSPRRSTPISPRDYLMQLSGYYFGEAT